MPKKEVVDRSVPVASVLIEGYGVPPCAVETAIGKSCNLRQYIEETFPYHVPAKKLFEEKRKEHIGYCRDH
jgi:hypothetical protein